MPNDCWYNIDIDLCKHSYTGRVEAVSETSIIIIIIIIKKRSAVQSWERVIYTLSARRPQPRKGWGPTYRQKEEKGKESRRL